jgi:hypothetical protein
VKKFWRNFRTAKDLREREEKAKLKEEFLKEVKFLIATFGHEGEEMYRKLLNDTFPQKSPEDIDEDVRQYHDAVRERRSLGADWQ